MSEACPIHPSLRPRQAPGDEFVSAVSASPAVLLASLTAALAGFLFGFDTVVISGAEQRIQALWGLSNGLHGVAMASALYGTVVGAVFAGWPTDRFGRRATLISIGLLYLACAIGSALSQNVYQLIAARLLGGLGIGLSTVAAPLYIAEISPAASRGRMTGLFQLNVVFGILCAYASNAMIAGTGPQDWRWMMGVAGIPALIYALLCLKISESPRWLALRASQLARGPDSPRGHSIPRIKQGSHFWVRSMRAPIMLAILIALFNQLSGINAVLYFAPRVFTLAGLSERSALLQSVGIGLTNLSFTLIGLWLIDRLGRRTLLYVGSLGYIGSLACTAWGFSTFHYAIIPVSIFVFIASHAVGQGAVIWVYIAEVFPDEQRADGQALGCFTHWTMAALITTAFPTLIAAFPPAYAFVFFCSMMILQLIWVKTMVVETRGVPLELMERRLATQWYAG
jgi:MFS transporter, SP family, arabinose:H+ symporter